MGRYDMVAFIVFVVMFASVLRAWIGRNRPRSSGVAGGGAIDDAETRALREEVTRLRDRLQVLERITVEKENSLAREIESLRER